MGRCREIGRSNFSPQMIEDWVAIYKKKGYALPAVYQGYYSLLFRHEEATLFPVLRRHGIAFFAYSPLAFGFLSGRLTVSTMEGSARFTDQGDIGDVLRSMFDRAELHEAVLALQPILEARGITHVAAAQRWVAYHSALRAYLGDAIILGASRIEQMEQNVAAIAEGPLPADIVERIEAICAKAAAAAPGTMADAVVEAGGVGDSKNESK